MNFKDYKNFVINYKPFDWEIQDYHFRPYVNTSHSFILNFIRFYKVNKYLEIISKEKNFENPKIVDVGAFPGNMVFLSKEIFKNISKYTSIGLDLDEKFIQKMGELKVTCVNTEIDPSFPEPKNIVEWNIEEYDICYLLDTIEHLVDPIFCLDQINKALKVGGYILITTDNITNFLYIVDMLRKGKSPNVHPVLSSMTYRGNHRPHHKEYSKYELCYLLKQCGFELTNHEYFDRKQGDFYIDKNSRKLKKYKTKRKIKNLLHELIKKIGFIIPHLRNHHIILAKKVKNTNEILNDRKVVYTKQEWMKKRFDTIGY